MLEKPGSIPTSALLVLNVSAPDILQHPAPQPGAPLFGAPRPERPSAPANPAHDAPRAARLAPVPAAIGGGRGRAAHPPQSLPRASSALLLPPLHAPFAAPYAAVIACLTPHVRAHPPPPFRSCAPHRSTTHLFLPLIWWRRPLRSAARGAKQQGQGRRQCEARRAARGVKSAEAGSEAVRGAARGARRKISRGRVGGSARRGARRAAQNQQGQCEALRATSCTK